MKLTLKAKKLSILCSLIVAMPLSGKELVDPTRPQNTRKTTSIPMTRIVPDSWALESIVLAPDRRVAVINGQRVSEGDSVNSAVVIRIGKLDVLIQTPNEQRVLLNLLPEVIKRQR